MASELCMNCFSVKGQYEVCPYCGYVEGTPPAQPHCLTPGTILGNHFIVGTVIGFGGFGITYKCYDTTLGITVAVKEFYPMGLVNRSPGETKVGLLSGDKKEQYRAQLRRFLMEAQSVAQFGKAKDIVNIYDYFEENGTAYIIMEYIDGILLKDYLEKQGAMPPEVAMSVIMPIIEAVKKIHSKGIIHRDISPDNIFITDEKSVKIFDFGAAQLNDSREGMAGEKVIKVGYSAPEQYRDKSRQGFYTDIYSVGAIMYQLLTGRKPVESTEREYRDKMKSPLEMGVKVNSNVDRAVMEAMAVQPELRYQGIQQFEEALRNKRAAEYPKEKIRKRKRRRNWMIASAATLVLAMGVAITLVKTVFKPKNPIFESTISEGVDKIVIWVENEDQKNWVKDVFDNGFHKGDIELSEENNKQRWGKFWEENEKIGDINVEVYPDMEAQLKTTAKEQLPDMYITDHVSAEQKTDLISLKDVYDGLTEKEYAYLNEKTYTGEFPKYQELPTGLDTLLLYVCELDKDLENKNTLNEKSEVFKQDDFEQDEKSGANVIKVNTVLERFKNIESKEVMEDGQPTDILAFEGDAIVNFVLLQDAEAWEPVFSIESEGNLPDCTSLVHIQKLNEQAHYQPKYLLGSDLDANEETDTKQEIKVYGNQIISGVAFRKKLEDVKNNLEDVKNNNGKRNRLKKYQTYVVRNDKEEMLVIYSERFGIRNSTDANRIVACERMLYLMMQSRAQSWKDNSGVETTFPIRIEELKAFEDTHGHITDFVELYQHEKKCIVVGDVTGNMYEFEKGLGGKTDSDEIKEYSKEYTKGNTEESSERADDIDKDAEGAAEEQPAAE